MKNTLFDEKMDGTVHIALGNSYTDLGGTNESPDPLGPRQGPPVGGRIELDGVVVQRDGAGCRVSRRREVRAVTSARAAPSQTGGRAAPAERRRLEHVAPQVLEHAPDRPERRRAAEVEHAGREHPGAGGGLVVRHLGVEAGAEEARDHARSPSSRAASPGWWRRSRSRSRRPSRRSWSRCESGALEQPRRRRRRRRTSNGPCRVPSSLARYCTPQRRASGRPSSRQSLIRRIVDPASRPSRRSCWRRGRSSRPPRSRNRSTTS